jgi:hypothetical protein
MRMSIKHLAGHPMRKKGRTPSVEARVVGTKQRFRKSEESRFYDCIPFLPLFLFLFLFSTLFYGFSVFWSSAFFGRLDVARTASPCPCVNKSSTDKASFQCSHTRANFDIYLPQPRNESNQYAPQTSEFRAYTVYLFSYPRSYNAAPTFHGPRCQYAEDDRGTQYHDCRPAGRYRGFATGGTERGTEM